MFSTEETYSHFCSNLSTSFSVRYEQYVCLILETLILAFFIVDLFTRIILCNCQIIIIYNQSYKSDNQLFIIMKLKSCFTIDETAFEFSKTAFH